jgi:O-antigen ligase
VTQRSADASAVGRTLEPAGAAELLLGWAVVFLTTLGPVYTARFHLGGFIGPWEDDAWVRATFVVLYLACAAALVRSGLLGQLRAASWRLVPLAALGAAALASMAWSVSPDQTPWRSVLFCGSIVAGAYLGLRFSVRDLLRVTAAATLTGVVVGVAVVLLWPDTGLMDREGAYWAGIYFNRNSFAPVCAVAVLSLGVLAWTETGWRRLLCAAGAVLSGVALLGTQSRTALAALGVCGVAAALAAAARLARHRGVSARATGAVCAAVVALALVVAYVGFDRAIAAVGVDPTLDNRTPLWNFVRMEIGLRRFRGYGFYAYWANPTLSIRAIGWLNWAPPTAHNGFLETGLGLGIPAMVTLIATTAWTLVDTARRVWRSMTAVGVWPLLIVVYFVVANLTESFVLPNQFLWVLFVAVAAASLRDVSTPATADRQREEPRSVVPA